MRRSAEFAAVLRCGSRVRRGALVVHALGGRPEESPHLGLVVGRSVGNSVARHRVSRRLRPQLAARLDRIPRHTAIVVRALPDAAGASSAALGADLDRALPAVLARSGGVRP